MAGDSSSPKQHEFYFVSYPFLESPDSKLAERDFAKNRKLRSERIDALKAKRIERKEVVDKITPLLHEEKAKKERCGEINKRLSELNFNLKDVRAPKNPDENTTKYPSEAALDIAIKKVEAEIININNTGKHQNHLLKQIRDLERSRGLVLSIEDLNLKMKLKEIWNEKKELRDIDSKIRSLEEDLRHYNQYLNQAFPSINELRANRYKNNELCLQMRAERDDALFDFFMVNQNISDMENRSRLEVEKFMKLWNENKEFREEYKRRKLKESCWGNQQ